MDGSRRKNVSGGGGGGGDPKEKMRTHMMFMKTAEKEPKKKFRRVKYDEKHQKSSQSAVQEKDVGVQTPPLLDPTQWTGNQRVVHFGPMAQRDPFYYYYPKGWDILYPAHFGFFPYRTTKSRGSSPIVCFVAFGVFFTLGGLSMTYLGYSDILKEFAVGSLQPLRIAGPVLLILGCFFLLIGSIWWLFSLQLCNEHLRHTQPHHAEPRKVYVRETTADEPNYAKSFLSTNKSPYLPPPPIPVLANAHTEASLYKPTAEMKLFPPIIPGATSTLSLPRSIISYNTQFNTMSTTYGGHGAGESIAAYENDGPWPEYYSGKVSSGYSDRMNRR